MPAHWTAGLPISIHTLRMEGDPGRGFQLPKLDGISIHTLRMEGDDCKLSYRTEFPVFQSTPSAWRVTIGGQVIRYRVSISIHTLRMEGDDCATVG